jgi:putative transcriptional regulator
MNGMSVNYKKLWHILIDRDMKKKDLEEAAQLTHYQMTKLANNKNVTTDVLGRICKVLNCNTDDIMEFVENEDQ